ncbi:MAG: aldo/keto reductase [Acetatifactor sp.]|nr:aldo/keto reductase [Acetatifactor sp.]
MKFAEHSYINKKISRIFYGTASMPFLAGEDGSELLDAMYGLGVNAFDIARGYGGAERSVGNWVEERGIREDVVLLSKCGHPDDQGNKRVNEKAIREDFAMSSEALRTDYIDIYLLHRDDLDVPAGEVVEIMNALYTEGKIRAFGGSNWTHQRIAEANEYADKHSLIPFTISSPNFGLADQIRDPWGSGCITISGPSNKEARFWYTENQMPVIAYSSLGRGLFSGKIKSEALERAPKVLDEAALRGYGCQENYERLRRCEELAEKKHCTVPQIAMAWIYSQKLNTFAVVSTSSAKRMQENIEALYMELTEEECAYLDLQKI